MASQSPGGTRRPSTPWVMISPGPSGQSVLTTGSPARMPSTMVIPKDSIAEETARTDPLASSGSMGMTCPISRTWPPRPSSPICRASASRCTCGPVQPQAPVGAFDDDLGEGADQVAIALDGDEPPGGDDELRVQAGGRHRELGHAVGHRPDPHAGQPQ